VTESMDDYTARHRTAWRVAEVSEQIGVSQQTISEWLITGQLRGRKVGRVWLIPTSALDELLGVDH
jgi:excisionase family DNA binding protein